MRTWIGVAAVLVAAGCSSGGDDATHSGSNGGNGGGAATTTCQGAFERAVRCGEATASMEDEYATWCKGWYACASAAFVPEYATDYWPCANARACGESDDACADAIGMRRYERGPDHRAIVQGM